MCCFKDFLAKYAKRLESVRRRGLVYVYWTTFLPTIRVGRGKCAKNIVAARYTRAQVTKDWVWGLKKPRFFCREVYS